MKRNISKLLVQVTLVVGLLFLTVPQSVSAITVSGKACPFFAGQTFPVPPGTTGDPAHDNYHLDITDPTIMPPHIGVCSGSKVSISAVGIWGHPALSGPDGTGGRDDTHDEYVDLGGISRVIAPLNTLVGVFLTDDPPDPGAMPDSLNLYLGDDMTTPELQQAFAIGSSLENITVPEGATRLFFGLNDGYEWINNVGSLEVTVTTIVHIDIKPGSFPNSINPDSKGVIPVAILSTDNFDATLVDQATVRFGPDEAPPLRWAFEDVDGDGDIDMILQFKTQETGIKAGDTEATTTGETVDGIPITGTDSVRTVPKGKK
jgi:hypothetical protein